MGNFPSPQILNEPKSLNHALSGTLGFDSIQHRSSFRSPRLTFRSCMRSTKWSRTAAGSRDQVSIWGTVAPTYSPKTKRPSSSPSCFTWPGSLAARNRSASWKNAFSFCCWASIPCSMSSTRTRLSLRSRCLARISTCFAILGGRVTLRRICFATGCLLARFGIGIVAPFYTSLVHY